MNPLNVSSAGDRAMITGPSTLTSPAPSRNVPAAHTTERVSDLESEAWRIEKVVPRFKDEHNKQFYLRLRKATEQYCPGERTRHAAGAQSLIGVQYRRPA